MRKSSKTIVTMAGLAWAIAASPMASAQQQCCNPVPCTYIGDVTGDGFPDAVDLAAMVDILFFGAPRSPFLGSEDLNGDGFPDAVDLAGLVDVLFFGASSDFPFRQYVLKGRSGPGSKWLMCDDSIQYVIGDATQGIFEIGENGPYQELGPGQCDKTDTLCIPAGLTIKGSPSILFPSVFLVRRTGYVVAVGKPDDPIVFTSSNPPGSRARGDWGGFVINGCACNNNASNPISPYVFETEGGNAGIGGGTIENDNSGCYKYLRVEFAGRQFFLDNELNGITLTSVGNGTCFEYIQINQNFDDGIEWFGGTVDCRNSVVSGIGDDGFDSDWGARWRGQYLIVIQDPVTGPTTDNHNGFEWDNQAGSPFNDAPRMKPTIWNATLVGTDCNMVLNRHDGAHVRRGADGNINNTVWTKWKAALEYDENTAWDTLGYTPCHTRFSLPGNPDARIEINHSIWYDVRLASGNATQTNENPYLPATVGGVHPNNVFPALGCGNPELLIQVATYDGVTPLDFRPFAGDPRGVGINAAGAVPPVDGWFDPLGATFKGALQQNDPAPWYAGWTNFAQD